MWLFIFNFWRFLIFNWYFILWDRIIKLFSELFRHWLKWNVSNIISKVESINFCSICFWYLIGLFLRGWDLSYWNVNHAINDNFLVFFVLNWYVKSIINRYDWFFICNYRFFSWNCFFYWIENCSMNFWNHV